MPCVSNPRKHSGSLSLSPQPVNSLLHWHLPAYSRYSRRGYPKRAPPRPSRLRWASSRPRRQRRARKTPLSRRPTGPQTQIQPQTAPQRVRPRQVSPARLAQHLRTAQTFQMVLLRSACQTQKARQFPPEQPRVHGHQAPPRLPKLPISATNRPPAPLRLPSNRQSPRRLPSTSLSHKLSSPTPPHSVQGPQRVQYHSQTLQPTGGQRTR